jgi:excinuclease ABC subunit C
MIQITSTLEFESKKIPAEPGVYLFKDENNEILYIGKATNLRQRVRSYFSHNDKAPKTHKLVQRIRKIDWIIVNNEVEALLLENKLVKQHTPKYNINLKDAKTFAYIALTRESYPRIFTSRKASAKLETFGPYTEGFTRQDLQRLVVRVFKIRTCRKLPKRACLNYHMNLCTAPCIGKATPEQYTAQVEQARSLLSGKYEETIQMLKTQMKEASKEQRFEHALELRNQIASIRLLTERQIVDKERVFDQDVMVFRKHGDKTLVVQMSVKKGVLLGKKEFSIDYQPQVEEEFLKAFYSTNLIPREILLNKPCWQNNQERRALMAFFAQKRGAPVSIVIPRKAHKLSLVKLAEKNLESALEENVALMDLQTALNLPTHPRIIECFDVSNLGREHIVSGMARFTDAKPDKRNYRRFRIRTLAGQDDLAAIHEVVTRRYKRLTEERAQLPDLIVIDGGSGQVAAAQSALKRFGLQIPLIGLAKENEEIYLPEEPVPLRFNKSSRMMLLLRQIRDATHDFSLGYSRKRRQMKMREEFKSKSVGKKRVKRNPQA